jgi:hypothetical protein
LLNEQWVTEEIRAEIKSFLEAIENVKTTIENLRDRVKAVLRGKFIALSVYIKRTARSQMNELVPHLKLLEKQEQGKSKTSRRREIIKIRAEIYVIETEKNCKRINDTKSSFFETINKIDKPLANLTKMKREKTQISKIRNKKKKSITIKTQGIIRDDFENLYSNKLEYLEKVDKFLDTYDHSKLTKKILAT